MDKKLIERAAKESGIDLRHYYDETGLTIADLSKFLARIDAELDGQMQEVLAQAEKNENHEATIAQQDKRIAFLEEERQEFLTIINKIGKAVDYDFGGGLADLVIARLDDQAALIEKCERGLAAVESLIDESSGVAGLHLNGVVALWTELREGGNNEGWLIEFDEAIAAIAAHRSAAIAKDAP